MHRQLALFLAIIVLAFVTSTVSGAPPQQEVPGRPEITGQHMLILYDQRSPDLAATLSWANQIAKQCNKVNVPWFSSDVRTPTMTDDLTGARKVPRDQSLTPPWFLKKFDHSFSQGSVILQGYGTKNGNTVRFNRVLVVGSITGPGRFVRSPFIDAATPLLREIMQASARDWTDAVEEPEEYENKRIEDSVVLAKANYGVIARHIYILGSGPPDRQQPKAWLDYAVSLSQQAGLPTSGANLWEDKDRENKDNMQFAPSWLFDRFGRFLENGLIVMVGYGTKNGTLVRHRRIMIAGYGGMGGGQPAQEVRGYVRGIKNSPSSEWLDASVRPDVVALGNGDHYFDCEDPNNPSNRREVVRTPEPARQPRPEPPPPPKAEPPVQKVQPSIQTKEVDNSGRYKIALAGATVLIVAMIAAIIALHQHHTRHYRRLFKPKKDGTKPDHDPELA